MKAIIDGRRYNTDSATLIGEADGGEGVGKLDYWTAGLYRTAKGSYFLAGRGGPMTRWAKKISQNNYSGGAGIFALPADEAREWAERNLSTAAVEQHFAAVIEDA